MAQGAPIVIVLDDDDDEEEEELRASATGALKEAASSSSSPSSEGVASLRTSTSRGTEAHGDDAPQQDEDIMESAALDDAYVEHFEGVLAEMLDRPRNRVLFGEDELQMFEAWRRSGLSIAAKIIYVSLIGRIGPWFQVHDLLSRFRAREERKRGRLGIEPVGSEFREESRRAVEQAVGELEAAGLVKTLEKEHDVDVLVEAADTCLRAPDLLKVLKRFCKEKSLASRNREGLLDALRDFGRSGERPGGQTRLTAHFTSSSKARPPIAEQIRAVLLENMGEDRFTVRAGETVLLRRADGHATLFRRMLRLHYCAAHAGDVLSVRQPLQSLPGLMERFNKAVFVPVAPDLRAPLFPDRRGFMHWEAATELHWTLAQAVEMRRRSGAGGTDADEESPRKRARREQEAERAEGELVEHVRSQLVPAYGVDVGPADQPLDTRLVLAAEQCLGVLPLRAMSGPAWWTLAELLGLEEGPVAKEDEQEGGKGIETDEGFREFEAGWVLVTALWEGLEAGAIKDKAERVRIMHRILRLDLARHRRGKVWECLAKDVMVADRGDQAQKRALDVCRLALMDDHVGGGDRMALYRRAQRLESLLKNRGWVGQRLQTTFSYRVGGGAAVEHTGIAAYQEGPGDYRWDQTAEEVFLGFCFPRDGVWHPEEDVVDGQPRNSETGVKSRFFSHHDDGRQDFQVSVERLYLEEYANDKEGAWWGLHCEGALLRALFSLLLFEQLFLDVPGAFVSRHQDAPLDLHQPWLFYQRRERELERRLYEIGSMSGAQLAAAVHSAWAAHFGKCCRGLGWALPGELYQAAAVGMGGPALAKALRPFVFNMRYYSGGLPDLFLLRVRRGGGEGEGRRPEPVDLAAWLGVSPELLDGIARGRRQKVDKEELRQCRCITEEDLQDVKVEVMMVEVKGPNDRLDDRQRAWMCILSNAKINTRLGRVTLPDRRASEGGEEGAAEGKGKGKRRFSRQGKARQ